MSNYMKEYVRQAEAPQHKIDTMNTQQEKHFRRDEEVILKFLHDKDVPSWFRGISWFQVNAANSLFNALRDDCEQQTTHRVRACIGRIGLNPLVCNKDVKVLMRLCGGNDLAFLWFLWELHYKSSSAKNSYTVNEQLILSIIAHLDMITTLRELDRILPPPQPPKKEMVRQQRLEELKSKQSVNRKKDKPEYVSPYFEKLNRPKPYGKPLSISIPDFMVSFGFYQNYTDKNYVVSNESNRWYGGYKMQTSRRIINNILNEQIGNMFDDFTRVSLKADTFRNICEHHKTLEELENNLETELRIIARDRCLKHLDTEGQHKEATRNRIVKQLDRDVAKHMCKFKKLTEKTRRLTLCHVLSSECAGHEMDDINSAIDCSRFLGLDEIIPVSDEDSCESDNGSNKSQKKDDKAPATSNQTQKKDDKAPATSDQTQNKGDGAAANSDQTQKKDDGAAAKSRRKSKKGGKTPATSDQAQTTDDEAPAKSRRKSKKGGKAAANSDQAQTTDDEAPAKSRRRSTKGGKAAANSDQAQSTDDEAPAKSRRKSTKGGKTPANSDQSQTTDDEAPAKSRRRSTKGGKPAANSDEAQSTDDEAPAKSRRKSTKGGKTPANPAQTPNKDDKTPANSDQTSNTDDKAPAKSRRKSTKGNKGAGDSDQTQKKDDKAPADSNQTQDKDDGASIKSRRKSKKGGKALANSDQAQTTDDEASIKSRRKSKKGGKALANSDQTQKKDDKAPANSDQTQNKGDKAQVKSSDKSEQEKRKKVAENARAARQQQGMGDNVEDDKLDSNEESQENVCCVGREKKKMRICRESKAGIRKSRASDASDSYMKSYDFGHYDPVSPTESQTFFQVPKEHNPYQFDYNKIFSFKDNTEEKLNIKKAFVEALDNGVTIVNRDEDAPPDYNRAVKDCVHSIWKEQVAIKNEEIRKQEEEEAKKVKKTPLNYDLDYYDPEDSELMNNMLKDALEYMTKDTKFVLASMPDAHKVPFLREWIYQRYGKLYTRAARYRELQVSIKIFRALDKITQDVPMPHNKMLGNQLYVDYSCRDYLIKKANYIKKQYYNRLDANIMEQARVFWFAMRPYLCSNGPPRNTYFAYMPSRVLDITRFRLWKTTEFMDAKRAFDKRRFKSMNNN